MDVLFDEKKTAGILGISPITLRIWRHKGEGPEYFRVGGSIRYAPGDLVKFLRKNKVEPKVKT